MPKTPKKPPFLTIDEIKKGLKDKKLYVVAKAIDVSYPTLKKFLDDDSKIKKHNFTIDTLTKISNYLNGLSAK